MEESSGAKTIGAKRIYWYYLNSHKINPVDHLKWCRRNLGDRGVSWDFYYCGKKLTIEVWGSKSIVIYELCKN